MFINKNQNHYASLAQAYLIQLCKTQISRNYKRTVSPTQWLRNQENILLSYFSNLRVQGQMAQRINVALSSIPSDCREIVEFIFFCAMGFTAGSLGLIWNLIFLLSIAVFYCQTVFLLREPQKQINSSQTKGWL